MSERRWMSMDEVFDQLEEAETEYLLQLWERGQDSEGADVGEKGHVGATGAANRRLGVRAAR